MSKCNLINDFCDFADKSGNCKNIQVSLEQNCLGNVNRKKEIILQIKRHLKGIEKAVEKLEKGE
jgi:hypothetical protein